MKMFFRKTSLLLFIVCFLLLAPLTSLAQTSLGILVGVVRDQTGAVVPKVTVTITGNEDNIVRTVVTQGDGAYRIEALRPQTYTVTVNQSGFAGFTAKNVIVSPSETTTYDVNLVVGATKEAVSVEADSIAINTENGQLTGIVNSTDLQKLPIFSQSPYELATTVPGAQIVQPTAVSATVRHFRSTDPALEPTTSSSTARRSMTSPSPDRPSSPLFPIRSATSPC